MTITIDVQLREPLTEEEHNTIVQNISERIGYERGAGTIGFTKIDFCFARMTEAAKRDPAN
jgi:hypothetical protein